MILSTFGREIIRKPRERAAARLVERRVTPNLLTIAGVVLTIPVCIALAYGQWWLAFVLFFPPGICDILDGEVARLSGQRTKFGAFLDSTLDRYSDLMVYLGLLIVWHDNVWRIVIVFAALSGSILTSYTRARAESLMPEFKCGAFERADRIIVLMAGCLLQLPLAAIVIITLLSNITAVQRMLYTRRQLGE